MPLDHHQLTLSGVLAEPAVVRRGHTYFRLRYTPEDRDQDLPAEDRTVSEGVLPCAVSSEAAPGLGSVPAGTSLQVAGFLVLPGVRDTQLRLAASEVRAGPPAVNADIPAPECARGRAALHLVRPAVTGSGEG
ncbi:hypothetical protein ACWD0J_20870 [Streptomyces sp. NPDC003011]